MQENMQAKISSRKIIIIICAAVVVVTAAVIMLISKREEAYRSILVYELQGNAVIERADIGAIDAAENLYLESGDRVRVEDESMMRMKLDNDKYITAEANTIFTLEAKGNERDSKTKINLEQGAITNEIRNPLSGESLYETSTPNSVMAVRGTIYRAAVYDDGNGGQNTRMSCFEGTVAVTPIYPDGTMGEEILVHAGSELTVYSDGTTGAVKDIDFESLPDFLSSFGRNDADTDEEENESIEVVEEDVVKEVATEPAVEDESEQDENDSQKESRNSTQTVRNTGNSRTTNESESRQTPQKQDPKDSVPVNTPSAPGGGNSDNVNSGQDTDSGSSDNGNSDQGAGDENTAGDTNGGSGGKPQTPPQKQKYTVTFRYQGALFATQSVTKGDKASAPALAPASTGAWDFDFDTKINSNTTIEWKQ